MSSWSDGYNADIAYTHGAYRELSPGYLSFVCLLNGVRPPRVDRPFRYCELGCGQGMTLNILAATHPHARFCGVDFNPLHIAGARRLAEEAELANVSYHERSFQDFAAEIARAEATDDQFDFIVLHGVYSWVSPENRRFIVDILARGLKPGGLVYISYNSLPGWAPIMPLQKLIMAHAAGNPARSDRQFDAALAFLNRLSGAGAQYFVTNALTGQHLGALAGHDRRYLAHEYLNAHWEPLGHAQVAADLEPAKLNFACSSNILLNIDDLLFSPEIRAMLGEIDDPRLGQTVRDYALNQMFRRDVFVRGLDRLDRQEMVEEMRRQRCTLMVPRGEAGPSVQVPLGELRHAEDLALPILDALASGAPSLGEIETMPALVRHDFGTITRFVALTVAAGHAHPVVPAPEAGGGSSARLNRAIGQRVLAGAELGFLAAPVLGVGAPADHLNRITLTGLLNGQPIDPATLAALAARTLKAAGKAVMDENGARIEDLDAMTARLTTVLAEKLPLMLPVWRRIGIL